MTSIFLKICYVLFRVYLYVLFNINHRLYMENYIPFLKSIGVNVKGAPSFIGYQVRFDGTDNFSLIELNDNCTITGSS